MRFRTVVPALALLLGVAPASAAPAPRAKEGGPAFYRTAWGVAGPDGATAWVVGAAGKVEALDLATGKVRWSSAEAGRPLALVGRRLAMAVAEQGKANTLRLILVDEKGKKTWQSQPMAFPEGVVVGRLLTSTLWSDGAHLYLPWRGRSGFGRGRFDEAPAEQGVAKVALKDGKVKMLQAEAAPRPPAPKVSEEILRALRTGRGWDGPGGRGGPGRGGLPARPFPAALPGVNGKHYVAVTVKRGAPTREAVLLRWDRTTQKALPPVVLAKSEQALTALLSADHRTALVRVRKESDEEDTRVVWRFYSTATGKELGGFTDEAGEAWPTALAERAFYVADDPTPGPGARRARSLVAVEVKTGKVLWRRPIEARQPLRGRGGLP
jgi:hypothetical protein